MLIDIKTGKLSSDQLISSDPNTVHTMRSWWPDVGDLRKIATMQFLHGNRVCKETIFCHDDKEYLLKWDIDPPVSFFIKYLYAYLTNILGMALLFEKKVIGDNRLMRQGWTTVWVKSYASRSCLWMWSSAAS